MPDSYLYKLIVLTDSATRVFEILILISPKTILQKIALSCSVGSADTHATEIINSDSSAKQYLLTLKGKRLEDFTINGVTFVDTAFTLEPGSKH